MILSSLFFLISFNHSNKNKLKFSFQNSNSIFQYKKNTVYYCSSAAFNEISSRCSLYSTIHSTNNTLIRDTSTIYYEKYCFPGVGNYPFQTQFVFWKCFTSIFTHNSFICFLIEQIAELCNGALIERQPQHVLITYPDAILTTPTLVKCLLKCLRSLLDGRTFQCHSLMYFYQVSLIIILLLSFKYYIRCWLLHRFLSFHNLHQKIQINFKQKIDNCILNSRSKRNNPDSLMEETTSAVDYFDLDECLNVPLMASDVFKKLF